MTKMRARRGLLDVDSTLANRKPELRVNIDREKASWFGLKVQDIADTLRTLVGGIIIGTYRENDDLFDVWLRSDPAGRSTQEALEDVTLRLPTGGLVQLVNLVNFQEARGPNQIDRFQRQRKVTIVANLAPDKPLGEAMEEVQEIVRQV